MGSRAHAWRTLFNNYVCVCMRRAPGSTTIDVLPCFTLSCAHILMCVVVHACRKTRDKQVSSAARSLITVFREINPAMLAKKDRGRGADAGEGRMPGCMGTCVWYTNVHGFVSVWTLDKRGRRRSSVCLQKPHSLFLLHA